jgi:hypothetical protein
MIIFQHSGNLQDVEKFPDIDSLPKSNMTMCVGEGSSGSKRERKDT